MTLERGALLHNRYRILEILGQGGMGSIYRAVDDNLGVEVAVKENLFTTEEYARQFRREAIILASLRHPNLPRVSDHFVIEGQGQYLIMDYIEGEDLRERMDRLGILSEEEVIVIGVAMCDAMAYMHTQKPSVLHRDIKPGNVRIAPDGHVYLVDFGLAKVVQGGQQTTTGARAMTPGYSPPEQYGGARTDHRSDIYSLGATLYAALAGTVPEDSLARTMEQAELTSIRKRNPKVSRRLANAIEKALAVHPDNRFQSAEEFKQAMLSARSNTLRRMAEQATLPPIDKDAELVALLDEVEDERPKRAASQAAAGKAASLLPIPATNAQLDDEFDLALPDRPPGKRQRGCVLPALLLLLFLVIAALVAYGLDPTLPEQLAAVLPPSLLGQQTSSLTPTDLSIIVEPTATLTLPVLDVTQAAPVEPTTTATALPPSETPTLTATPQPSDTPTLTPMPTSSATLAPSPTITPIGGGQGQIAFASDRTGLYQIWLANADGSDARQITNTQQGACQPDWSPDGQRIVFISPCNGYQEVYQDASLFIINADGTGLTPLATVGGGDFDPDWSPDGSKILFTSLRTGDRPQIFVLELADNSVTRLSDGEKWDLQPAWSSDGERIAFVSTRNGPYQIWTMTADGLSELRFSASGSKKNLAPLWSGDDNLIIFTQSDTEGAIPRLMGARFPDGSGNEFRIYTASGINPMRAGDLSPDGLWLVFESWPDGVNHDIYLMTPNGAERTRIVADPAYDFDPAWRPILP
ncbi:MAG: protein kinase [Anaerolineales bacterium]|nr:protein kinase [Anaerolineales bacterium]